MQRHNGLNLIKVVTISGLRTQFCIGDVRDTKHEFTHSTAPFGKVTSGCVSYEAKSALSVTLTHSFLFARDVICFFRRPPP